MQRRIRRKMEFIRELFVIRSLVSYKRKSKLKPFLEPESNPPWSFGETKVVAPSTTISFVSLPPNKGCAGG